MKFNLINDGNKGQSKQFINDDQINPIDLSSIILAVSDENAQNNNRLQSHNFDNFDRQIDQNYNFDETGQKQLFNQTQKHKINILAKVEEKNLISEIKNMKIDLLNLDTQQSQAILKNVEQEIGNFSSVNSKFFTDEMKDLQVALGNGRLIDKNNYGEIYNIVNISKDDAESIINLLRDYVVVQIGNGKEIKIPKLDLGVLPNDFPYEIKNEINNMMNQNNIQFLNNPSALSELTGESNQFEQKDTKIEASDMQDGNEFCDLLNQSSHQNSQTLSDQQQIKSYAQMADIKNSQNNNQGANYFENHNQLQGNSSSAYQQMQFQQNKSSFNNTTTQEEPCTVTGNENTSSNNQIKSKFNKQISEIQTTGFQQDSKQKIQDKLIPSYHSGNQDEETDFVELISNLNSSKLNKNYDGKKKKQNNNSNQSNEELLINLMQLKQQKQIKKLNQIKIDTQKNMIKGPEIFFNGESPIISFIPISNNKQFDNQQNNNIFINDEKNQQIHENNKQTNPDMASDQNQSEFSNEILNEQIIPLTIENNYIGKDQQMFSKDEKIFHEIEDQEIFKDMKDLQNMKNASNVIVSNISKNYYKANKSHVENNQLNNDKIYDQNQQDLSEFNDNIQFDNVYENNNCVNSFEQTYNQDFIKDMTHFDYNSNLSKSIASAGYAENLENSLCLNNIDDINTKNRSRHQFINNFATGKYKGQCFLDITNQGIIFPENFLVEKESLGSQLGGNNKGRKYLEQHKIPTKRVNSGTRYNRQGYNACNDTGNLKQLLEQCGFQQMNGTISNKRGCFNFEQALQNISHISMRDEVNVQIEKCKTQRPVKNQKKYQDKQLQKQKNKINNFNIQKSFKVKQNVLLLPKSPTSSVGQGRNFEFQNGNQDKTQIQRQRNLKSQQNSNQQSIKVSQRNPDPINNQDKNNINGLNSPHQMKPNSQLKDQNKIKMAQIEQTKKQKPDQQQQQNKNSKKSVKSITPSFGVGAIVNSVGSSRTQKIIVSQTAKNYQQPNKKVKVSIQQNNYLVHPKQNNDNILINIPGTTKSYQSQQSHGSSQNFNKIFKNNIKKKEDLNKNSRTNNTIFNEGLDYASIQSIYNKDALQQKDKNKIAVVQKVNQIQDTLASVQSQRTNRSFKSQISQKGIRQLKNFNKNQSKGQSSKNNYQEQPQQFLIDNFIQNQDQSNKQQNFEIQESNNQKLSKQKILSNKVLSARYISQPPATSVSENQQNEFKSIQKNAFFSVGQKCAQPIDSQSKANQNYQSLINQIQITQPNNKCESDISQELSRAQNSGLSNLYIYKNQSQNTQQIQKQDFSENQADAKRSNYNQNIELQQAKIIQNQSFKNENNYNFLQQNNQEPQIFKLQNEQQNIYQMKIQTNQNYQPSPQLKNENLNSSINQYKGQQSANQVFKNKFPCDKDFNIDQFESEQLKNKHQPLIGVKKLVSAQVTGRASDTIIKIQKVQSSKAQDQMNFQNENTKLINSMNSNQKDKREENEIITKFEKKLNARQSISQNNNQTDYTSEVQQVQYKKSASYNQKEQNKKTINIKNLINQSKNKRLTMEQTGNNDVTSQGHSSSKVKLQNLQNQIRIHQSQNFDSNNKESKKLNSIISLEQKYKMTEVSTSQNNQIIDQSQIATIIENQEIKVQQNLAVKPFVSTVQPKLKGNQNSFKISLVNRQGAIIKQRKVIEQQDHSIALKNPDSKKELIKNFQSLGEQSSQQKIGIQSMNKQQYQYFNNQQTSQQVQSSGLQKVLKQNLLKLQKAQKQIQEQDLNIKKVQTIQSDKKNDEKVINKQNILQIRNINPAKGKSVGANQNQNQQKQIIQTHSSSTIRLNTGKVQALQLIQDQTYGLKSNAQKCENDNFESIQVTKIANPIKQLKPAKIKLSFNREPSKESQKSIGDGSIKVLDNFVDQKYHSTQKRNYQLQNVIAGVPSNTTLNSNQNNPASGGDTKVFDCEKFKQQSTNSYQNSSKLGVQVNNFKIIGKEDTVQDGHLENLSSGFQNLPNQQPMKKALLIKQLLFKQQQRLNLNIGSSGNGQQNLKNECE